jgi:Ser/Thr protein kinase RdoA (MazF antagonist)
VSAIAAHLAATYGIEVDGAAEIEQGGGVFHVRRADGPDWIARWFPADRPLELAQGDAAILRFLADTEFPAERCAHPDPVSVLDGRAVLVTEHAGGVNGRPDHSARTLGVMGDLLGRLHTTYGEGGALDRPAGGWHHLSKAGGTRAEDVRILLGQLGDGALHERLRDELTALDTFDGLPTALLHPDFGPANVMVQPDGSLVVIDWTNAGRGARIYPLGVLLASAAWGIDLVDAVMIPYASHVSLTDEELDRLPDAIHGFGVVLAGWYAVNVPPMAVQKVNELAGDRALAEQIAARVRELLRS